MFIWLKLPLTISEHLFIQLWEGCLADKYKFQISKTGYTKNIKLTLATTVYPNLTLPSSPFRKPVHQIFMGAVSYSLVTGFGPQAYTSE